MTSMTVVNGVPVQVSHDAMMQLTSEIEWSISRMRLYTARHLAHVLNVPSSKVSAWKSRRMPVHAVGKGAFVPDLFDIAAVVNWLIAEREILA